MSAWAVISCSLMDVILPVTELDRANAIFERILYTTPPEPELKPARELQQGHGVFQPERQAPEQVKVRRREKEPEPVSKPQEDHQEQAKPQREVTRQPDEQGREKAPVTQRPASTPKKGSRSERDLRATKTSSSTRSENGASRATSERSSVELRLRGFRQQLNQRKKNVPTKKSCIQKNIGERGCICQKDMI